ncbi:MAG: PDZ domain-containing protein [Bacteroidia bacterium]|nr:PDZ domain-containing protein [Bacteroidia bacterium]
MLTLFACFLGMNTIHAQTETEEKVTIKTTYEDKDGKKHTELKELIGEEAEKFDMKAYEKELADKGMKLLTVDVTKNMEGISKEKHKSKDHNVMIIKKGSDDEKEITIIKEGDQEGNYFITKSEIEEDGIKKQKVMVKAAGDEMEGEEIKVEVKDGKVYINGEEVEEPEMEGDEKEHKIVIKEIIEHEGGHSNTWISKDGEVIELKEMGDNMIFISKDDMDEKPRLGIMVEDGKDVNGAAIIDLIEDSPAVIAGLKKGDVITAINGQKVFGVTSLLAALEELEEGDEVEVTYMRNGKEMSKDIALEKLHEEHKKIEKKVIKKIKER